MVTDTTATADYLDMLRQRGISYIVTEQHAPLADTLATIGAKDMLMHPGRTIGEIAYSLGYQSPQYFSRALKKAEGCSPNAYRRSFFS